MNRCARAGMDAGARALLRLLRSKEPEPLTAPTWRWGDDAWNLVCVGDDEEPHRFMHPGTPHADFRRDHAGPEREDEDCEG